VSAPGVPATGAGRVCVACGSQLAPSFVACPRCGQLVHADELKRLAADAERAEQAGDLPGALGAWRQTLALLPPASVQHQKILAKVTALSARVPAGAMPAAASAAASRPAARAASGGRSRWAKWLGSLGVVGVLLLKFKWVLLFLLSKGKVLLIGLTQAKTFLTMAIAIGVYTTVWGWRFALGLVISMYVHEMGHVIWLRRYGIPASAPMFVPGLGAFVRLNQHPATVGEDARVGLAGPVWGAAAAIAALVAGALLDRPILMAIASVGAWINLFNLLPVWQLDGGRGFAALSRGQRWAVAVAFWLIALAGVDGLFFILAIAATARAVAKSDPTTPGAAPAKGDRAVLATFLILIAGLTAIMVGAGKQARSARAGERAAEVSTE
jgi:Zn-dependent protease